MHTACQLIAVDLDGTLLDSRGRISARNEAALRAAEAHGVRVLVATGRSWSESRHVLEPIGYRAPLVGAGGSLLTETPTGRTLRRSALDAPLVREVTAPLLRHGHAALLLKDVPEGGHEYVIVGDSALDPATSWWFETHRVRHLRVDSIDADPHPHDTVRIGVVARGATLADMVAELRRDVADRAFMQHWPAVTEREPTGSETHLLEIFHPTVSKWSMIEAYCRDAGIDPARTAAIGDGLNDVEMLRGAGLGIAMANAGPAAREAASQTTGHHDEHGVADAIERILDGVHSW